MIVGLIIGAICGAVATAGFMWVDNQECPRVIYGYRCKGKGCDHDPRLVAQAKWDTRDKGGPGIGGPQF